MSYHTNYDGFLEFTCELTTKQLNHLTKILGEDSRDHPEWDLPAYCADLYFVDLELADDFSGLDPPEDSDGRDMVNQVSAVIELMKRIKPEFGLAGEFKAQGEERGDCWVLKIVDGKAVRVDQPTLDDTCVCPHCNQQFLLSSAMIYDRSQR